MGASVPVIATAFYGTSLGEKFQRVQQPATLTANCVGSALVWGESVTVWSLTTTLSGAWTPPPFPPPLGDGWYGPTTNWSGAAFRYRTTTGLWVQSNSGGVTIPIWENEAAVGGNGGFRITYPDTRGDYGGAFTYNDPQFTYEIWPPDVIASTDEHPMRLIAFPSVQVTIDEQTFIDGGAL